MAPLVEFEKIALAARVADCEADGGAALFDARDLPWSARVGAARIAGAAAERFGREAAGADATRKPGRVGDLAQAIDVGRALAGAEFECSHQRERKVLAEVVADEPELALARQRDRLAVGHGGDGSAILKSQRAGFGGAPAAAGESDKGEGKAGGAGKRHQIPPILR